MTGIQRSLTRADETPGIAVTDWGFQETVSYPTPAALGVCVLQEIWGKFYCVSAFSREEQKGDLEYDNRITANQYNSFTLC